jgi:hypothetical protein
VYMASGFGNASRCGSFFMLLFQSRIEMLIVTMIDLISLNGWTLRFLLFTSHQAGYFSTALRFHRVDRKKIAFHFISSLLVWLDWSLQHDAFDSSAINWTHRTMSGGFLLIVFNTSSTKGLRAGIIL